MSELICPCPLQTVSLEPRAAAICFIILREAVDVSIVSLFLEPRDGELNLATRIHEGYMLLTVTAYQNISKLGK